MPPVAIVFGPTDVPVGENGCLTSATRTLPSEVVYFCAWMIGATQNNRSMAIERRIICFGGRILGDNQSERINIPQMSDTLQLVVNVPNTQTQQKPRNECPIRFSLSPTLRTLNTTRTTQLSKCSTNVRYALACRRRS